MSNIQHLMKTLNKLVKILNLINLMVQKMSLIMTKIIKPKEPKNKESMKRLKFNKEFNGVGNALKMIPESYRTDNKEFEMTDGVESYRTLEGTLLKVKL
jgi:hypothetical protein